MTTRKLIFNYLSIIFFSLISGITAAQSWVSDNGNGTYTNPLFYEEFSDPSMIRVGDDFYLTGTTMHTMPGLPILHSKDLVNWRLIGYAFDTLNLGPEFRLENHREAYGQGIWAPSFSYHDGTYYIFANVNHHTTQIYRARNPTGPWKHGHMQCALHDLSVFFDDNDKVYVAWGARTIRLAQLKDDLTDTIPGTSRIIATNVGEGSHIHKIKGKYYISWAVPGATTPMLCGRADNIYGPYEVVTVSEHDHMGVSMGYRVSGKSIQNGPPFVIEDPHPSVGLTLHQGGFIDTPTGQWWGYSMQDHNSIGRVLNLAPITWQDGFPYFGLPGNLAKTPRTWIKPDLGKQPIRPMMDRNDEFSNDKLNLAWQWNHVPAFDQWSLAARPGYLRLHALPADNFWWARNTLTQRAVGPQSICTTALDAAGMKAGDKAGLALLNLPYAWIGVVKTDHGVFIRVFDQTTQSESDGNPLPEAALTQPMVFLRVEADFLSEKAQFSYSFDGQNFKPLGSEFTMAFQLKTFQGVRYCIFSYNHTGTEGGYADFDYFHVDEPHPGGFLRPIPYGKTVSFKSKADGSYLTVDGDHLVAEQGPIKAAAKFEVIDRGLGRVALREASGKTFISIDGSGNVSLRGNDPGNSETFQWIELEGGDLVLLSLATNRYLNVQSAAEISAAKSNPDPSRKDGTSFIWEEE